MILPRLIEAKPQSGFRMWLKYSDGTEGVADLSDLAGQGVFTIWDQPGSFENFRIGSGGELGWSDQVDICPDALYFELTGQNPDELFALRASHA